MYSIIEKYGNENEAIVKLVNTKDEFIAFVGEKLVGTEYALLEGVQVSDISNKKYLLGNYLLKNLNSLILVEKYPSKGYVYGQYHYVRTVNNWKLIPDSQKIAEIEEARRLSEEEAVRIASENAIRQTVTEIQNSTLIPNVQ